MVDAVSAECVVCGVSVVCVMSVVSEHRIPVLYIICVLRVWFLYVWCVRV